MNESNTNSCHSPTEFSQPHSFHICTSRHSFFILSPFLTTNNILIKSHRSLLSIRIILSLESNWCQLSATGPFQSLQPVFGTACRSTSRLHRLFPPSEAVWRLTSSAPAIQLSSPRSDSSLRPFMLLLLLLLVSLRQPHSSHSTSHTPHLAHVWQPCSILIHHSFHAAILHSFSRCLKTTRFTNRFHLTPSSFCTSFND